MNWGCLVVGVGGWGMGMWGLGLGFWVWGIGFWGFVIGDGTPAFPNPGSRIPNPGPQGISLRDPNACDSVPRSTYSSSPPSGTPWARRLGRTPWLRASWAR